MTFAGSIQLPNSDDDSEPGLLSRLGGAAAAVRAEVFGEPPKLCYACRLMDYSSEYGLADKAYSAAKCLGAPQVYPSYGDDMQAAVLRTYGKVWPDSYARWQGDATHASDFITVRFSQQRSIGVKDRAPGFLQRVSVYETYNPGCCVRILALEVTEDTSTEDRERGHVRWKEGRWHELWSGPPQSDDAENLQRSAHGEGTLFSPPMAATTFLTDTIRLEFDCRQSDYYYEVDAIAGLFSFAAAPPDLGALSLAEEDEEDEEDALTRTESELGRAAAAFALLGPDEMACILAMLSVPERLCFRRVNKDARVAVDMSFRLTELWRTIDLQPFCLAVTDDAEMARQLAAFTEETEVLSLAWCSRLCSSEGWSSLLASSALRSLNLACTNVSDASLAAMDCPSLESLVLHRAPLVTDAGIAALLADGKHAKLKSLNLYSTRLTHESLRVIGGCLAETLEDLNLGACTLGRPRAGGPQAWERVLEPLHACSHLKRLDLWRVGLNPSSIARLAEACTELEELDIGWCISNSNSGIDGAVEALATHCPNLRKLFLTSIRTATDAGISAFTRRPGPCKLQSLDILGASITEDALNELLGKCPDLKFLDVSFCNNVTEESVATWRAEYEMLDVKSSYTKRN